MASPGALPLLVRFPLDQFRAPRKRPITSLRRGRMCALQHLVGVPEGSKGPSGGDFAAAFGDAGNGGRGRAVADTHGVWGVGYGVELAGVQASIIRCS